MASAKRMIIDCRDFPNEIGCSLMISGNAREVLKAAVRHAVEEHGHQDTPELYRQIKSLMKTETPKNLLEHTAKKIKSKKSKGEKK